MEKANKTQARNRNVPVGYHLFLYREALRCPKASRTKLSKAKYTLTNDLVVITWDNITSYSKEERNHLVDSIVYKSKLKKKIEKKSKKSRSESAKL